MSHPSTSSSPSYAASTYSVSTTYSTDAFKTGPSSSSSQSRRSLGKKVKSVLSSIGEDPTARYNRKHGQETKPVYMPAMPISRI